METVKGLTTEDILRDAANFLPPMRPEGLGVTIYELGRKANLRDDKAMEYVASKNFVGVKMRSVNGRVITVYMPAEDAELYRDWIVDNK